MFELMEILREKSFLNVFLEKNNLEMNISTNLYKEPPFMHQNGFHHLENMFIERPQV